MATTSWRFFVALGLGGALFLSGCGDDDDDVATDTTTAQTATTTTTTSTTSGTTDELRLTASLTGAAERPGPGDPDGTGTATVTLDTASYQVCYALTVTGIEQATAAHIHTGTADVAGPVLIPLEAPTTGSSEACTTADAAAVRDIAANPSGFYVNVHNGPYPMGAVRGQLSR